MVKQGLPMPFVGPKPFCGITKAVTREWIVHKSMEWWWNSPEQRQAKQFIIEYSAKFMAGLISKDRKTVKVIVGVLTGHCKLNRQLQLMGFFGNLEEGTAEHILCQ